MSRIAIMDSVKLRYTLKGAGWTDLKSSKIATRSLSFQASDLGPDPLAKLIRATLDLHSFFQGSHPHRDFSDFSISIELYGEPSGLQIIFFPKEFSSVRLKVYHANDVDSIPYRQMLHSSEKSLVLEGDIDAVAFGRQLFDEAARVLRSTGLRGYHDLWGSDFPLAEFLRLHGQVAGISSSDGNTLEQELVILREVLREPKGE